MTFVVFILGLLSGTFIGAVLMGAAIADHRHQQGRRDQ